MKHAKRSSFRETSFAKQAVFSIFEHEVVSKITIRIYIELPYLSPDFLSGDN